ncbi:MAG: transposase family protein [Bacteroidales bacterium]
MRRNNGFNAPNPPKNGSGQTPDEQKAYYSSKKKAHTLKNQIAVRPDGQIEAVSENVPGGANHDSLLRQSKLLDQLHPEEETMMDKGYDGIGKDYPRLRLTLPFKARRNHPKEVIQSSGFPLPHRGGAFFSANEPFLSSVSGISPQP